MSKFDYYRLLDSMPIRTLALLMLNLNPEQVDKEGLPERFDWEDVAVHSDLLLAAADAGTLDVAEGSVMPTTVDTKVITSSAVLWFRSHGYESLSNWLDLSDSDSNRHCVKRKDLIDALRPEWPKIESDLKRAPTNGLSSAQLGHGNWDVDAARAWAKENLRLVSEKPQSKGFNDPFSRT